MKYLLYIKTHWIMHRGVSLKRMLTGRLKSLITNTLRDSIYIVRYCNDDSINNSNDVYIFI